MFTKKIEKKNCVGSLFFFFPSDDTERNFPKKCIALERVC